MERRIYKFVVEIFQAILCLIIFFGTIYILINFKEIKNKYLVETNKERFLEYLDSEPFIYTYVNDIEIKTNDIEGETKDIESKLYKINLDEIKLENMEWVLNKFITDNVGYIEKINNLQEKENENVDGYIFGKNIAIGFKSKYEYAYYYFKNGEIFLQVAKTKFMQNEPITYHKDELENYINVYKGIGTKEDFMPILNTNKFAAGLIKYEDMH